MGWQALNALRVASLQLLCHQGSVRALNQGATRQLANPVDKMLVSSSS